MIDARILDRFRSEFVDSKERMARARERVNVVTAELTAANKAVDDEQEIQEAINAALQVLGLEPFS